MPKGTPIKRGKPDGGYCWSFMDYGHCINPNCTFKHYFPPGQTAHLWPLPVYTYIRDYNKYRIYDGLELYRYGGGHGFDEETENSDEETENSDEETKNSEDCEEYEDEEQDNDSDSSCATESTSDSGHGERWSQEDRDWRRIVELARRRAQMEAQTRLDFDHESDSHDDTHHSTVHEVRGT